MVVVLLVAVPAQAKCAGEWLAASPAGDVELPPEPHVLVYLGGRHERVDAAEALEFTAGAQRVAVKVVSSFDGYMQRLVLVKPVKALPPSRWTLQFKKDAKPADLGGRSVGSWRVGTTVDTTPPSFTSTPTLGETSWHEFGCGPGSTIGLKGVSLSEPAAFVEAAVTTGSGTTTAVLAQKDGLVDLGHGMCSGAFDLKPGTKATVVLTPIDLAGNRGAKSAPIDVTAPGPTP